MKINYRRMIQTGSALFVLLAVLIISLSLMYNRQAKSSIKSGLFEDRYTSVISDLQQEIRLLREKLKAGSTVSLDVLPDETETAQFLPPEEYVSENQAAISGTEEKSSPASITLKGIYWSEAMPLADINGKLCKPGETVAGFTVEQIHPYHIVLSLPDGRTVTNSLLDR